MNKNDIANVTLTWAFIQDKYTFVGDFYTKLFQAVPEARAMFPNIDDQAQKLVDVLHVVVASADDLSPLAETLTLLGDKHRALGVEAGGFQAVGLVLLETLRDHGATPDQEESWARFYNAIVQGMGY